MRPTLWLLAVALAAGDGLTAEPPKPVEFVLLDGDTPLLVSLRAELDGVPVTALWADAFATLFAYHDRNGDGVLDSGEASTVPTARALRQAMGSGFTPPSGPAPEFGQLDGNSNGKVTPAEFTGYYTSWGLGNLVVGVGKLPESSPLTTAIVKHLDGDGDGSLSESEWKAAADTMKKLDKNDDELIGAGELVANAVYPGAAGTHLLASSSAAVTTPELISKCPLVRLSGDPNDTAWAAELAKRTPKLTAADLPDWRQKEPAKEWVVKLSGQSSAVDRFTVSGNAVRVEGWQSAGKLPEATETVRKELLAQLDAPEPDGLSWLLPTADRDGDGQLDRKELDAWLDLQSKLCRGQVLVTVLDGGGLFEVIDTDHDGALSVRELRTAWGTLTAAGYTSDGKCDPAKLPRVLLAVASVGYPQTIAVGSRRGPDWFRAMDRNGDGDVSKREFTGTPAVFADLDTDHDGLLDATEAERASQKK